MFKKLMFFFRMNILLEEQNKSYFQTINILQGEIDILRQWNKELKDEKNQLQDIIYKRFNLIPDNSQVVMSESKLESVKVSSNWASIKADLERKDRLKAQDLGIVDETLKKQQEYWASKKEQIKVEEPNSGTTN